MSETLRYAAMIMKIVHVKAQNMKRFVETHRGRSGEGCRRARAAGGMGLQGYADFYRAADGPAAGGRAEAGIHYRQRPGS